MNEKGAISIEVEQVDFLPLFRLRDVFGGQISRRGTRDVWRWRLSRFNHVVRALRFISDWGHGVKKYQAAAALYYLDAKTTAANAAKIIKSLKRHRTGVESILNDGIKNTGSLRFSSPLPHSPRG